MKWEECAVVGCFVVPCAFGAYLLVSTYEPQEEVEARWCANRWPTHETRTVDDGGLYYQCLVKVDGMFYPEENVKIGR
mgnify:CR=1 FL=1